MSNENKNKNWTDDIHADENDLIKIRRDKLDELKANNKNPFDITKVNVGTLNINIIGEFDSYENKRFA